MMAIMLSLLLQLTPSPNEDLSAGGAMVQGWTRADMIEIFTAAGLHDIANTTADPNFPTLTGRTARGFPVQAVFAVCGARPPAVDDLCNGVDLSIIIPATEQRWADVIVASLEPAVPGVNAMTLPVMSAGGPSGQVVSIGHYMVSDGGVTAQFAGEYLSFLLGIADQTAQFMLTDDPAHAQLWQPGADQP